MKHKKVNARNWFGCYLFLVILVAFGASEKAEARESLAPHFQSSLLDVEITEPNGNGTINETYTFTANVSTSANYDGGPITYTWRFFTSEGSTTNEYIDIPPRTHSELSDSVEFSWIAGGFHRVNVLAQVEGEDGYLSDEVFFPVEVPAFLASPFPGVASVSSVFDHSTPRYAADPNDYVLTWLGEQKNISYDGHAGVDYVGIGYLPVYAAADSTKVVHAGWSNPTNHLSGFGIYVKLLHPNGYYTIYGHLNSISVQTCDQPNCPYVQQGEVIGIGGDTGNSTNEHLHFEVRTPYDAETTTPVDPYGYNPLPNMPEKPDFLLTQPNSLWLYYPDVSGAPSEYPDGEGNALDLPDYPSTGVVIDDYAHLLPEENAPNFSVEPDCWESSGEQEEGYAENDYYLLIEADVGYDENDNIGTCWARWYLPADQPTGEYGVYVHVPRSYHRHFADNVLYRVIRGGNEIAQVPVSQFGINNIVFNGTTFSDDPTIEAGWIYIGSYWFSQNSENYVEVTDRVIGDTIDVSVPGWDKPTIENTWIGVDAVKFARGTSAQNVDIVLIIDSSGSMVWNDPDDLRLDASRFFVRHATVQNDYVGVIDFDWYGQIATDPPLQKLHENDTSVIDAINSIDSNGGTNIGFGIQSGCDVLIQSDRLDYRKGAILLADGDGGFNGQDDCFSGRGWPIFIFGFGDANDALLQQIAINTGGRYTRVDNLTSLTCEFIRVRSLIANVEPPPCYPWSVPQLGSTTFPQTIAPQQAQATFSIGWPGSDVIMTLTAPSGRVIDRNTTASDVLHENGSTYETYTILHPEAGEWTVELYGADVPTEGEEVIFGFASVPAPEGVTFEVDSTGDTGDSSPGDGVCADSGGNCTLRAAIEESNARVGADTINFNIAGTGLHTIQLQSALPAISDPVVLNGATQPGYDTTMTPIIVLDGTNAGPGANGLIITSGGSTIRGLVIHSFDGAGIYVDTAGSNRLVGNFIGTDSDGMGAAPNLVGIKILGTGYDIIGGTGETDRNLISGNSLDGIYLSDQASSTLIQGNYIGTNLTGDAPLPNGGDGIDAQNVSDITIGGTDLGAGNLISGNGGYGIRFNNGNSGAVIQGNIIGTDISGTAAVPNTTIGIGIRNSYNTTIGGTETDARNFISGNIFAGIYLGEGAANTFIQGNYIGTDIDGFEALPNSGGIEVQGATNTTIGGIGPGAGNLISGNSLFGININTGVDNTIIQGNTIGADLVGTGVLPNENGIVVLASTNTTIGGTLAEASNLISGNTYDGINVSGGASGVLIQGNYIGTDIDGMQALPNLDDGVDIEESAGTTVGGSAPNAGNLISGNGNHGIEVFDSITPPTGVIIQGNKIGTDLTGSAGIPNPGYGIIIDGVTGATIGGTDLGAGNTVAFNGYDGITVVNGSAGITISGNSLFNNNALGIDLGFDRVTANDLGDLDTGPNGLQNFPVITLATSDGESTSVIEGSLNSTASTDFQLEFFAVAVCDIDGNGEGEIYLGGLPVTTEASGDVSFIANLSVGIPEGHYVTATATDSAGNTSEFSACQAAVVDPGQADLNHQLVSLSTDSMIWSPTLTDASFTLNTSVTYSYPSMEPSNMYSILDDNLVFPEMFEMELDSDTVLQPDAIEAGSLVVNSIGDSSDLVPGDGVCDDGRGNCTLRAAIEEANATRTTDTIDFSISGEGPYIIQQETPLPEILAPVVINGATQRGYTGTPVIVLDGAFAGEWVSGFVLRADGSTISSLAIVNFKRAGIHVLGDENVIQNNFIGVDPSSRNASGNSIGILVEDASRTLIGGDTRAEGNLISGNEIGVYIYGDLATNNMIQSNRIGTDASGQTALGNQIGVRINTASENQIWANLISGNQTGILLQGEEANGNQVYRNLIGLDETGENVLGNDEVGIWILNAPGNAIGGEDSAEGNRILGSERAIFAQGLDAVDALFESNETDDLLSAEAEFSTEMIMSSANADDDSPVIPPGAE